MFFSPSSHPNWSFSSHRRVITVTMRTYQRGITVRYMHIVTVDPKDRGTAPRSLYPFCVRSTFPFIPFEPPKLNVLSVFGEKRTCTWYRALFNLSSSSSLWLSSLQFRDTQVYEPETRVLLGSFCLRRSLCLFSIWSSLDPFVFSSHCLFSILISLNVQHINPGVFSVCWSL